MRTPLETVWAECGVLLLNRHLSAAERQRIRDLGRPPLVDLYQNWQLG